MTEMVKGYNFAFIDEYAKREIRRKILKAVSIPGYQVPFGSRELPIARGWGTGALQITLSLIGKKDILKIIDQGCDDSVNAVNIKRFVKSTTGVSIVSDTLKATIIQTRHRIPEEEMGDEQILVFQVPYPEPLRIVEPQESQTRRMHGEMDYAKIWVFLYENIVQWEEVTIGARYPVMVEDRYIMDPSPIPRYDVPRLNNASTLYLFGAGREKRIYAVPPFTKVKPLEFEDYKFRTENFEGKRCEHCKSTDTFLDEIVTGDKRIYSCSDTSFCKKRRNNSRTKKRI